MKKLFFILLLILTTSCVKEVSRKRLPQTNSYQFNQSLKITKMNKNYDKNKKKREKLHNENKSKKTKTTKKRSTFDFH